MTPIEFPYALLKPRAYSFDIVGGTISGGVSNSGQQQVVNAGGGGLWALRMDGFIIRTPAQIRAWRRMQYGGQSGVIPINVKVCEIRTAPRLADVPHSDDSPFGDDSLYSGGAANGTVIIDAPNRATSMTVAVGGTGLEGGELFSVEYATGFHSLHAVTKVMATGGNFVISFQPPLRAEIAADAIMEFAHPMLTVRMANAEALSMSLEMGKFSSPSATFIEYFGGEYVPSPISCETTPYDFAALMQELVN